tara:strand:+ start:6427 stop:7503 length:1077 start_codon:yes stop_codon:yes gene_type:complete
MLSDLTDELIWPRILRAPALAIAPNRLLSGCLGVFLIALILNIYNWLRSISNPRDAFSQADLIAPTISERFEGIMQAIITLDAPAFAGQIELAIMALRNSVMNNLVLTLLLGIPIIVVIALVGGAISRSVAFEFAQGRFASREETVHFTLQRSRQYIYALIAPILFASALMFIIALGGLLLSFPVLDILGGILYPIALILGAIATIVLVLHVVASPMIIPALSIEGTDAFDAIQRCYAYVIGRPIRYFAYAILLSIVGFLAASVFTMIIGLSMEMTDWSLNFFFSHSIESALTGEGDLGATKSLAHSAIEAFRGVLRILIAGYFVSLFYTSGTLLYLAIRRICDGQGITEIWEPVEEA